MQRLFSIFIICSLLFVFIIPFGSDAEEVIKKGEILDLKRCVEIALKIHPNIIAAMSASDVNESKIGQAKSNYYPQINWSSGYSKYSPVSRTMNRSFNEYTSSATLKQNIYDFGKTATQVDIQRLNLNSSHFDIDNVAEQLIFNVKQAYYGLLQAQKNRDVAIESIKQFEQHLKQAKGFYEVGIKSKFDVTKAEVDLSNAKLNMIRAENALKIAKVNLDNALGLPDAPEYEIKDDLSLQKYQISLADAIKLAYENRPDLKAIIARKRGAESSIELAKKNYYPTLSGNADYNWSGSKLPLGDGWDVGVTITFPIFSGFLTKYQVSEARANLNILKANEETLRQSVLLEVQQAYLNLREAEERISTTKIIVRQAEENLELANGRYGAGVGNPIEVTDAVVALSNAKTAYIQALTDYNVAMASIQKAMGIGSMEYSDKRMVKR
ncbi:outer membrane efflux protein [Dissulfurispira thermophila]|uniref:Outer membrane efflux protein n=1 Tax=Dissulfurispira thermophila TaxID=2715679 RepID=A0A7G1H4A8_9BACT|nr:TolC family protein [Dissulfurispira thermophila]BCB96746.1 outer membrane efflux protein [Dissulfurispira thermophila]